LQQQQQQQQQQKMSGNPRLTFASNPMQRQGAMDIGAAYDIAIKSKIRAGLKAGKNSLFRYSEDPAVEQTYERELLCSVRAGHRGSERLFVFSSLNGFGAEASRIYAGRPDAVDLVQAAVHNEITYAGVSIEALGASDTEQIRGIAVTLAGLNTVQQAANLPVNIQANDLIRAVVPKPANGAFAGRSNNNGQEGVPPQKYRLEAAPVDPASAGHWLRLHIRETLRDPVAWQAAMGPHHAGTAAWAAASSAVVDSYLTAVLLGVGVMVAGGLFTPSDRMLEALDVDFPVGGENGTKLASANLVAALAQALNLRHVPSGGVRARLQPDQRRDFGQLRHTLASTIFHDGVEGSVNARYEFANMGPNRDNPAISKTTRGPSASTPLGQMLTNQLNHFPRAVGAFHTAILDDQRMIIGRALTGIGQADGNLSVNVALGVCRP